MALALQPQPNGQRDRWLPLGDAGYEHHPGPSFLFSLVIVLLLLGSGLWYFRKTERSFADVI